MKRKWLALAAAGCLMLTSCELLPVEEQFRTAPLINEFEKEEFAKAECTRGDLTLSKSVTCTYVPVRTENLVFNVGGLLFDEFYVKAGESIHAGDLLAQLNIDGLEENIESAQRQVDTVQIQLVHLEQDRELALSRQRILNEGLSSAEANKALEKVNEQYDARRQSLEDSLSIAQMQVTACEKALAERQLRSSIDGTVTFVKKVQPYDVSTVGDRVITVADSTMSLFRAQTEYWEYYQPGETVTITANKTDYEATVVTEEELELNETPHVSGEKAYVYFVLNEPTFELEDNDRGSMTLILDKRESVLRVPEKAVSTINGETVVYYEDAEGMKAFKSVETGLQAENMIEIISGLEAGEMVICE